MALFYPDILEHNNPNNPLLDDGQLDGGMRVVADISEREAIPAAKRKVGAIVGYVDFDGIQTISKFIGADTSDFEWLNFSNWQNLLYPYAEILQQETLLAGGTTTIIIGDKTLYSSFVIRFQMTRDQIIAMGTIEVMHNTISLESPVYFSIRELGGSIGVVTITTTFSADDVELTIEIDNSLPSNDVEMVYDIVRKPFSSSPQWSELLSAQPLGTMTAVDMVSNTAGFTVGYNGLNMTIFAMTDGVTWFIQTSPVSLGALYGVSFADANTGWAVGNDGATGEGLIITTVNAGFNWTQQIPSFSMANFVLYSVKFINANTGWAVGYDSATSNAVILATTDGGANWSQQTSPILQAIYWGVWFVDANNGWAVGEKTGNVSCIIATTDGGANWVEQTSPDIGISRFNSVHFFDANTGIAGGISVTTDSLIAYTIDGGANWFAGTVPAGTIQSVQMTSALNGWAVGNDSILIMILKTSDGGANWTASASTPVTDDTLFGVSFPSDNVGYAVGQSLVLGQPNVLLLKYV